MTRYRGADPVVDLVYEAMTRRNKLAFKLFSHAESVVIRLEEVVEDAAFGVAVTSEYEHYHKRAHCEPGSDLSSVHTYSLQGTRVPPMRPTSFTTRYDEFPREGSVLTEACRCGGRPVTCPNCSGTRVVTCPKCYQPRSGKCRNCAGSGLVDCPQCGATGRCSGCGGSGTVRCPECSGRGTVLREWKERRTCRACSGRGYVSGYPCTNCYTTGVETVTRSEYVTCSRCGGEGRVPHSKCGGTGKCTRCGGEGHVPCEVCHGTGICQFCDGAGTKTCPTCGGGGTVTCPVCEGVGSLLLYVSDCYEYEPICDDDRVVPGYFKDVRDRLDSSLAVAMERLDADDLYSAIGLSNNRMLGTLDRAKELHSGLIARAKGRQFNTGSTDPDSALRAEARSKVESEVDRDWAANNSDSYYASYLLHVPGSARSTDSDRYYTTIIAMKHDFKTWPLGLVNYTAGGKPRTRYVVGTKEASVTTEKGASRRALGKVLAFVVGVFTLSVLLLNRFTSYQFYPAYGSLWLALALVSWASYFALLYRTVSTQTEELVVVTSTDDLDGLTLVAALAHCAAEEDAAVPEDPICEKLTAHLLGDRLVLGSSVCYTLSRSTGRGVRVLYMSGATVRTPTAAARALVSLASKVIVVVSAGADGADLLDSIVALVKDATSQKLLVAPEGVPVPDDIGGKKVNMDLSAVRGMLETASDSATRTLRPLLSQVIGD